MKSASRPNAAPGSTMIDMHSLVSGAIGQAFEHRQDIAVELAGTFAPEQNSVSCLTLLAGAGTRWVKSLAAAKESASMEGKPRGTAPGALPPKGAFVDFPLSAPRGLYPVRNFISGSTGPETIPLAAYAIDAFKGLGTTIIVTRGWQEEIRRQVLKPLGMQREQIDFLEQKPGPGGKVAGHGDAVRQAKNLWHGSKYVMVNFGGDANSPLTALSALLAMSALDNAGEGIELVLPVARIRNPAYPVQIDENGYPTAFGHDKLGGEKERAQSAGNQGQADDAYTNVGIRVYRASALAHAIDTIRKQYWSESEGYSIPGNDPAAHEFALDNVDSLLASCGKARILAIARPEELSPAKSFDEIPQFEDAIAKVRAEWDQFCLATASEKALYPWTRNRVERSRAQDRP
ncbi:MAG: hypothetical protein LLF89_03000 [Spirochaetaceae bacterium]|nr:hypothetical protein [Spirochaetaceae bacterium]